MPHELKVQSPIAMNIIPEDFLGYMQVGTEWEIVPGRRVEEGIVQRGWRLYSRSQRQTALRHGTIVAIAHGWRAFGLHETGFLYQGPLEKPFVIAEGNRFSRVTGAHAVNLVDEVTNPNAK